MAGPDDAIGQSEIAEPQGLQQRRNVGDHGGSFLEPRPFSPLAEKRDLTPQRLGSVPKPLEGFAAA
jgi:hypothetical protein